MRDGAIYLKGSIGGTMLRTAFSMLACYNLTDAYFVGQLPGAFRLSRKRMEIVSLSRAFL